MPAGPVLESNVNDPQNIRGQNIKVRMFNAHSLRNKFPDLEALVATHEFHIIGVTETWLNTNQKDLLAEYSLPGCVMFNSETVNRSGGGVLLHVKVSLQPSLKNNRNIDNPDPLTVQLITSSRKVLINLI